MTDTLRDYWWALAAADRAARAARGDPVVRRTPAPARAGPRPAGSPPTRSPTPSTPAPSSPRCTLAGGWVISWMTLEKIVLVGLVSAIYGLILPGVDDVDARALRRRSACWSSLNAAITLAFSRRNWTIESAGLAGRRPPRRQRRRWSSSPTSSSTAPRWLDDVLLPLPDQPDDHAARPLPAGLRLAARPRARSARRLSPRDARVPPLGFEPRLNRF